MLLQPRFRFASRWFSFLRSLSQSNRSLAVASAAMAPSARTKGADASASSASAPVRTNCSKGSSELSRLLALQAHIAPAADPIKRRATVKQEVEVKPKAEQKPAVKPLSKAALKRKAAEKAEQQRKLADKLRSRLTAANQGDSAEDAVAFHSQHQFIDWQKLKERKEAKEKAEQDRINAERQQATQLVQLLFRPEQIELAIEKLLSFDAELQECRHELIAQRNGRVHFDYTCVPESMHGNLLMRIFKMTCSSAPLIQRKPKLRDQHTPNSASSAESHEDAMEVDDDDEKQQTSNNSNDSSASDDDDEPLPAYEHFTLEEDWIRDAKLRLSVSPQCCVLRMRTCMRLQPHFYSIRDFVLTVTLQLVCLLFDVDFLLFCSSAAMRCPNSNRSTATQT